MSGTLHLRLDWSTQSAVRLHDAVFMEQALAIAELGRGRTSPNPLVGAVIVEENIDGSSEPKVLASGYHARPGGDHAEVDALRKLGGQAQGKTLYVTLEPCNHIGRTGKCTEAILAAGLRRVVVGMIDPNRRVCGGGISRLRDAGLEVTVEVLADRCAHQNRGYLQWLATGRPHLVMKAAVSLDGRLALATVSAKSPHAPQWLTSFAARHRAHQLRDRCDAILIGAGTVQADDPLLTVRLPAAEQRDTRQPWRVVLDGAMRTSPAARLCGPRTLLVVTETALRANFERAAALRDQGVELLALPAIQGDVAQAHSFDLDAVLQALGKRDLLFVMCEGGATLHGALLAKQLYSEATLFIAPLFLGAPGLPLCAQVRPDSLQAAPWLSQVQHESLGPDVLLTGLLRYGDFAPSHRSEETHVYRAD